MLAAFIPLWLVSKQPIAGFLLKFPGGNESLFGLEKKFQGLPENAERLEQLFGQQRRDLAIELQQLKEEALAQKAVVVEKADVDLTVPWLMKLKFKNLKIPFVH